MVILYIFFYISILAVSLIKFKPHDDKVITGMIFLALFFIVAFRGPNFGADYVSYIEMYNDKEYSIEVSFRLISSLIKNYLSDEVIFLFIIYAALGLCIKYISITRLTKLPLLSVALFCGYYCILHDLIQIRAAVASGLVLFSIPFIYYRKAIKYYSTILAAVLFHYSAIVMLPIYLLNPKAFNFRSLGAILIGSFVLYFLHIDVISIFMDFISIPYFNEKYDNYLLLQNNDISMFNKINIFNSLFLLRLGLLLIIVTNLKRLIKYNRYTVILTKLYLISVAMFVSLSFMPVFAFRISELLGIVEIILFPLLIYLVQPRIIGRIGVCLYSGLCFYIQVFYNKIIQIG